MAEQSRIPNRDEGDSPTTHVSDSKGTRAAAARLGTIETARAFLSGPTDTVVTLTVTTDSITGSIQGLTPGTYTVSVEGLIGGDVDHFGQATGVQVGSGATATATIAFLSFRPDLTGFTLTSTAAFSSLSSCSSRSLY